MPARAISWFAGAALALLAALPMPVAAQRAVDARAAVAHVPADTIAWSGMTRGWSSGVPSAQTGAVPRVMRGVSPELRQVAPLMSAVLPGAGQAVLGTDRFVAYLAAELLGWWSYAKDTHEQGIQEAAFKDIARHVARAPFTSNAAALPDASWAYYEQMRDFLESGSYSLASSGPVVPETDTLTYNGYKWLLAKRTHATLEGALAQYEQVAVRPEFQWSWRNAQLQYDIFKRTTALRNDAYRSAVQDLLVIGANHVLSMVDAFVAMRLEARPTADGGTAIGARLRW